MTDVRVHHTRRSRSSAPVRLLKSLMVLVLLAAAAPYFRVGWWRMESACSLDNAQETIATSVSYDWSWHPLGFQCTYDNGKTQTSLWF